MAISCRNYQVRTNLQPEIATTSVRTGLAMTKKGSLLCHCEERSDVVAQPFTRNECYGCGIPPAGAISCRYKLCITAPSP